MMRTGSRSSEGKVEIITGMYLLLFLTIILSAQIQMGFFMTAGTFMEDALAASNLASAVIDVQEYGISHTLQIAVPDDAYAIYRDALKVNLGLDENWEHGNKSLISGPITIQEYAIYNVKKQDVTIHVFSGNGGYSAWMVKDGLGKVETPDGTIVKSTSIYSRISFPIKGVLGMSVYADKEKTVDIVSSLLGEE